MCHLQYRSIKLMKNECSIIFCNMLLLDKIQYISRIITQYFGIYIIWVIVHYVSAHIYTKICVPSGLYGLVLSFILTPSPYCYTLRWIIFNGGNYITTMWVILGMWIVNKLPLIRE